MLKAMAAEPRPATPRRDELADDLRRFLAQEPVRARRPSWIDRTAKWSRRHRAAVWSGVGSLLLAAVGLLISTILIAGAWTLEREQRGLADQQRKRAEKHETIAKQEKETAVRQRDEAERNLYAAHIRLAAQDWEQGQITRLHETLGSHLPTPGRDDLRGWEWYCLLARCHDDLLTMRGHTAEVFSVAWSPDGRRLASGDADGQVRLWDRATGRTIRMLAGHREEVAVVAWSPDGSRLASAGSDRVIRVWDPESGQLIAQLRGHADVVRSVTWSPHGDRLASCALNKDSRIRVWDVASAKQLLAWDAGKFEPPFQVAWSPEGDRLAACHSRNSVVVWNALTGEVILERPVPDQPHRIAWSPDGRQMASGTWRGDVLVWDSATGGELAKMGHRDGISWLAWRPDGERLASAALDQRIVVWDPKTGAVRATLRGHLGRIPCVAWSPDGTCLASAGDDRTVRLWNVSEERDAAFGGEAAAEVAWNRDGRRLAVVAGNTAKVWDAEQRKELFTLGEAIRGITWDPAGRRLAIRRGDRTVVVWDADRRVELRQFNAASGIWGPFEGASRSIGAPTGDCSPWPKATTWGSTTPRPDNRDRRSADTSTKMPGPCAGVPTVAAWQWAVLTEPSGSGTPCRVSAF